MTDNKKKSNKRDAYDDFLDGAVTGTTPKSPTAKKASGGAKKTSTAAATKKAASGGTTKKTSTSSKTSGTATKTASTAKKSSSTAKKTTTSGTASKASMAKSGGRKKAEAVVQDGIVSLGQRRPVQAVPRVKSANGPSSKTSKSSTATKAKSATTSRAASKTQASSKAQGSGAARRRAPRTAGAVMAIDNPVAYTKTRVYAQAVDGGNGRGKEDMFLEEKSASGRKQSRPNQRKKSRKLRKRNSFHASGLDIFLSAGIVCILALCLWQGTQYSNFVMMKQTVDRQSFYQGTSVEGIDVSNMTLDAALEYWRDHVESRYTERAVALDNGATVTAQSLGYVSDYAAVLTNAWSAGRSGSLEERYAAITNRQNTPVAYTVTRSPYSESAVEQYVLAIAKEINKPAQDATIQSFNPDTYKFVLSEAEVGSKLDAEALKASIMQALDSGGGNVQMVVKAVEPTTSKDNIASQYGMIAYAVTNASSSSSNRLNNIKIALSSIHGTRLKPGETFSFNEIVGKRTQARGYKMATAYSSGEVTEQVGGGICQVSTTLFNAAVKSDMKIVERHHHSLTVAYVDKGKDASVNWGSQDIRFTNTSDDDIYISCLLTKDKRVRIGIFGRLLDNGETITVEGVTTGTIKYDTEYQVSGLLASGQQTVIQSGKNGYTAEAYKIRWDANGNQISRELLCSSRYRAKQQIVQYGP